MKFEIPRRKKEITMSFWLFLKNPIDFFINIPEKQLSYLHSLLNTSPLFKAKNIFKKQLCNFFYRILPQTSYIIEEEEEDEE